MSDPLGVEVTVDELKLKEEEEVDDPMEQDPDDEDYQPEVEVEVDELADDEETSESETVKKHGKTTKHPFRYTCPFCSKRYTSRSGLLSHKNTVHFQRKPYRCEHCNEHFFTSAGRVGHIKTRHPNAEKINRYTKHKTSDPLKTGESVLKVSNVQAVAAKPPLLLPKPPSPVFQLSLLQEPIYGEI